ncbi:MAG: iron-containing redox enzyme family protein [Acidimicrobiales bacterium]|nr:iron-containing redox enzyme family protein [Acidimicrobiales bacterium]MCB1250713.1 iron-containing redox enzyme family protein [Acidimicrobiales bacterium]
MSQGRAFKDIRGGGTGEAVPVEAFMAELEAIRDRVCVDRNRVWQHVADGTLSVPYLERYCKEYYFLGVQYTAEFGSLVSNAPDFDALDLGSSEHFEHWIQNLCDETGYAGDRNHVDMKVEWARAMGIPDADLVAYVPLPETIGMVLSTRFYMRRSYEEGLATFGWAGERFAAGTGYAKLMYEGMRDHYGMDIENFKVHAYAEADHGDAADYLLRQVVTTPLVQHRVRTAVEYVFSLRNARAVALNRWLDEPGALR